MRKCICGAPLRAEGKAYKKKYCSHHCRVVAYKQRCEERKKQK